MDGESSAQGAAPLPSPWPSPAFTADTRKRTRTSTPKVRTGCVTCKRRHIKCDETRPHCTNCLKRSGTCEGYGHSRRSSRSALSSHSSSLSPVKSEEAASMSQIDAAIARIPMQPPGGGSGGSEGLDFSDTTSMLYFNEFVNLVQGPWFTGTSNAHFWGVSSPQLARTNVTLRHAAMGIGALSMWYRGEVQDSPDSMRRGPCAPAEVEDNSHYSRALAYYGQSLQLQHQRASVQDTVFLSVLLLYFELLRGNRRAALDHVNHGLALLLALITDEQSQQLMGKIGPAPNAVFKQVADVFTHLGLQTRTVIHGRVGHCAPLPNLARGLRDKQHTMESFMLLLRQIPGVPHATAVPALCGDLDEFERCLTLMRARYAALGPVLMDMVHSHGILRSNDQSVIDAWHRDILGSPRVSAFCAERRAEMLALDSAFAPLYTRCVLADHDSPSYLRAIHLRLEYLGILIFENTAQFFDIGGMTAVTPAFREFMSLAETALRTVRQTIANPSHYLSLQCRLAWRLLLVAIFCRDALVRDQAIGLLRDYPGQDGLWKTHALYVLALRNRAVERANALEGAPAEQWQRLWRREFVFEDAGDRILFRYMVKDDMAGGGWVQVEEVADTTEPTEDVVWRRQPLSSQGKLLIGDLIPLKDE